MSTPQSLIVEKSAQYFIKDGYRARSRTEYFVDSIADSTGIIHQPDVYPFARYLAQRFGCSALVDIGCGHALKLAEYHPEFRLIGIDIGSNLNYCRSRYKFGQWIEWNLEDGGEIPVSEDS